MKVIHTELPGVLWHDPAIGIVWPVQKPIVSPAGAAFAALSPARGDLPEYAP